MGAQFYRGFVVIPTDLIEIQILVGKVMLGKRCAEFPTRPVERPKTLS
ncbi:hypothetical protein LEP1GSC021_2407 [Leptospira noguchii str. 1993005606]|nr:hypothetical protein LEP1GSC021_2407 [Leptospira noguchii str. 1993005606]